MNSAVSSSQELLAAFKNRRTYYGIAKEAVIPDERIEQIVRDVVLHTPSAFNSQSSRLVLLLGREHDKLWDLVRESLRKLVNDDEKFKSTEEKMNSFRGGYGTVLFWEEQSVVEQLQKSFESYKDRFPVWSEHASAMHQYAMWTALEAEGFGASLQHYNPIIDDEVRRTWNLPVSWHLVAQMPFGKPTSQPGEKTFQPVEERIRIFK
ncbi:nitroreductase family protein [Cohnella zeiphila]|uniref:Nitroreductase family protein n=1 Tax=Cohnella zeiphila TaxID=2761120 RepID=A0A7X0VZQ3_9BACL|nr:nitroreductase family protein [Cohnella zeiphila]MBB6735772.1 nitroreductase family protein [Cohnella zeiphila]